MSKELYLHADLGVFMRVYTEILSDLNNSIQTENNEHIKKIIKELNEHPDQDLKKGIQIARLKLDSDVCIEFGNIQMPLLITKTSGTGKLTIKNSSFQDVFTINNLDAYANKKLEFIDCIFHGKFKLSNIINQNNKNLSIVLKNANNSNIGLNLETHTVIVKRMVFENLELKQLSFLETSIKSLFASRSKISTSIFENTSNIKGLSRIIIDNSIYERDINFDQLPPIVPYSIRMYNSIIKGEILSKNSRKFNNYFKLENIECNLDKTIQFVNASFMKAVRIDIEKCEKFHMETNIINGINIVLRECKSLILSGNFNKEFRGNFQAIKTASIRGSFNNDTYFDKSTFNCSDFNGAQFTNYVSFKFCNFTKAPDFLGAKFTNHVSFYGAEFSDVTSTESEGRYRLLKDKMREVSNDADEILFSSYELESRHKDFKKSDRWQYFFSFLYWILNNYGRSLMRPVVSILIIWVFFAVVFFKFENSFYVDDKLGLPNIPILHELKISDNSAKAIEHHSWVTDTKFDSRPVQSMKFSAINMLGPLRLISFFEGFKVTTFAYMMLTWIQSVLATILWYLFIVGIKRRFRTG